MEHLQRTGLVDQAASPHKRARERLREKAEWVLGSRKGGKAAAGADGSVERPSRVQEVLERGGGAEGNASRTSGPTSNLSPLAASPVPVSSATQPRTLRSVCTSLTRPRSISTSTTTSLASVTSDAESETAEDAAVFSTLVAAFPRPPAIRVDATREKVSKLRLGALAESPLPSPPLSAASTIKGEDGFSRGMEEPGPRKERLGQAFEMREKQDPARRPGPPTIPLPPVPPSPSPSLRPPRSSSITSSLTPPLSPSPTASFPSSPSSRNAATNKPLPPLPPPPLALPPIPLREERERDVQHLLERFAWPESPSRVRAGRTAGSDESDESAVDARFGRGRRTSSISTDESGSDSDESLRMENITAELSSLIDSFRPSAEHTPETSRAASTSPTRAREEAQGERKASVASSVVSRVSMASSAWSSSGGSRAGQQENTTGGYRAYKLARKPSTTLHSLSSSRLNRSRSSSSLASSTSSSASSDSEELFDLSLDSPPLERERERGWSWFSAARRKSSATSVETDGGFGAGGRAGVGGKVGMRAKKASEGDVEDEKEVLRQSLELANPQDAALDVSPIPPTRLRTLHTAKSTPSLRRPSTLRPPSMVRRHSDWDIDRIDEEGQKPSIKEDAQTAQVEDKSKGLRPLFTASAATSPSRLPSPTTGQTRLPIAPAKDPRSPSISPVKTRPLLTLTNRSMLRPPTVRANTSPILPARTAPRPSVLAKRLSNLPLSAATTSALPRPSASRLPLSGSSSASSNPQTAQKGLRRLSSLGTLAYIPSS
ncbi:hypothetical protein JCM10049v2_005870 [Rhodotorula toruloides]